MNSTDTINGLKRYINNKSINIQEIMTNIDKKIIALNTYIVKIFKVIESQEKKLESQEKKIKTIALYQYKIMKILDNSKLNSIEKINKPNIDIIDDNIFDDNISENNISEDNISENNISENNISDDNISDEKELKKEFKKDILNIDNEFVKSCLKNCDINADINLFKKMYILNEECPIRYINKNNYQYWVNNKWNDDNSGDYIISIIIYNIKKLYIKANTYENFQGNIYKYQTYISKMLEKKYADTLIKAIKELIKI